MPTLTTTRNYADGVDLTEQQLDDALDSIETWANTTKLDSDNIQTGGIATANLASTCVTAAKIATDAVTTTKILDSNVTTAKINDLAVTTAKINDLAVTTGKINTGAVTQAKKETRSTGTSVSAGGYAVSDSSSTFSTTSTTLTDVTNLSVTITTLGNPVILELVGDGTNEAWIHADHNTAAVGTWMQLAFLEDTTVVSKQSCGFGGSDSGGNDSQVSYPPSAFRHSYQPAAGTYTYKVQVRANNGFLSVGGTTTVEVTNCKLVAYEL